MILREAFRYQNFLSNLKDELIIFLATRDNYMKIEDNHKYSSVNSEKADVTETKVCEYDMNKAIELINKIIEEKKNITSAISVAKSNCEFDIDSLLELNKFNTDILTTLKRLNGVTSKEEKTTGVDYKFNINGEQLSYKYPIERVYTINFDRNKTKGMVKNLSKQQTDVSNLIDKLNVTLEVNYEPKFNLDDKLEDILKAEPESESE